MPNAAERIEARTLRRVARGALVEANRLEPDRAFLLVENDVNAQETFTTASDLLTKSAAALQQRDTTIATLQQQLKDALTRAAAAESKLASANVLDPNAVAAYEQLRKIVEFNAGPTDGAKLAPPAAPAAVPVDQVADGKVLQIDVTK